jgi:predicted RNase H-like HicB family nuclease
MDYTILIHQAEEGGFWSEVPALSGCYSQGETIDETLQNSKEAIEAHLLALKEDPVAAPGRRELYHRPDPGRSSIVTVRCHTAVPSI